MSNFKKFLNISKEIRNIYNLEEINSFINKIIINKNISKSNNIHIYNWINRNFRNFILHNQTIEKIENSEGLTTEDWVINGLLNKTLSNVVLNTELKANIEHIIDYLIVRNPTKSLSKVSYFDMLQKSKEWTNNQAKVVDDLAGREIIHNFDDGFYVVNLKSKQAIDYEGVEMNHCLSKHYIREILNGGKTIYSLRDSKNNPHVTIMLDIKTNTIQEIKGNSNTAVKLEYQNYLVDLFNNLCFDDILVDERDFIPNIHFNENYGFYIKETIRNNKKDNYIATQSENFYKNRNRKLQFNFLTDNTYNLLEFLNKIKEDNKIINNLHLLNVTQDLNIFEHTNINNLKIESVVNNTDLFNNFTFNSSFVKNLELEITTNNSNIKLNIPNLKYLNIKSIKSSKLNNVDLSDLNLSQSTQCILENCSINNLTLPLHINSINMHSCILNKINLHSINCEELRVSNIKTEELLIAKNIYIEDISGLENNKCNILHLLKCENLFTNFNLNNTFIDNSEITNIIAKNIKNIKNINSLNLNIKENFEGIDFSYLYNRSITPKKTTPDADKKLFFDSLDSIIRSKEQVADHSMKKTFNQKELTHLISFNNSFAIDFDNVGIVLGNMGDSCLTFTTTKDFNKLPNKEKIDIYLYEFFCFIKNTNVLTDIEFDSIFKYKSIVLDNHIQNKIKHPKCTNVGEYAKDIIPSFSEFITIENILRDKIIAYLPSIIKFLKIESKEKIEDFDILNELNSNNLLFLKIKNISLILTEKKYNILSHKADETLMKQIMDYLGNFSNTEFVKKYNDLINTEGFSKIITDESVFREKMLHYAILNSLTENKITSNITSIKPK